MTGPAPVLLTTLYDGVPAVRLQVVNHQVRLGLPALRFLFRQARSLVRREGGSETTIYIALPSIG